MGERFEPHFNANFNPKSIVSLATSAFYRFNERIEAFFKICLELGIGCGRRIVNTWRSPYYGGVSISFQIGFGTLGPALIAHQTVPSSQRT